MSNGVKIESKTKSELADRLRRARFNLALAGEQLVEARSLYTSLSIYGVADAAKKELEKANEAYKRARAELEEAEAQLNAPETLPVVDLTVVTAVPKKLSASAKKRAAVAPQQVTQLELPAASISSADLSFATEQVRKFIGILRPDLQVAVTEELCKKRG